MPARARARYNNQTDPLINNDETRTGNGGHHSNSGVINGSDDGRKEEKGMYRKLRKRVVAVSFGVAVYETKSICADAAAFSQ
jgi:hypothetical protein